MAVDKLIWKMILDFFVLVCVSFPLLALMLWGEPNEQGYFANDTSIRLPYTEGSVGVGFLAGGGFALNVVTVRQHKQQLKQIIIVEVIRDRQGKGIGEKFLSGSVLPGWLWECYYTIGVFTFGASCQQLMADIPKYVIGKLRPHFIDVCRPFPILNSELNKLGYIQDYVCAGNDAGKIKEARLAFPSAHCSFSMYCAVFFICYLQVKGKWRGSKLLRHALQVAVLVAAWYTGLSRVQEHWHDWADVIAGYLIGAVFGILVFVYVLKPKKYSSIPMNWEEAQVPTNNLGLPRAVLAR